MQLIKFLEKEGAEAYREVMLIAVISGIANSLLLGIINHATEVVANQEDLTQHFLLYLFAFALFLYGQWYAFERAIEIIETTIFNVRIRLTSKVQQVELTFIEQVGANTLYGRLTQNDTLISQSVPLIVGSLQMLILMIFSLIYLGYISPISLIITLAGMGIGLIYFATQSRFIKQSLESARDKEQTYFKSISHLVNGFKEIKINQQKSQDLLARIASVSEDVQSIQSKVRSKESKMWGFGRLFIYMLLPIAVFIIPSFSHEHTDNIFKVSATLLFLIGPTNMLMNMFPLMSRVNIAVSELSILEREMDAAIAQTDHLPYETSLVDFKKITINSLSFFYSQGQEEDFSAGPFNEQINKGELLFIVGGNGSGKSTFLKLLTGLYYPKQGELVADQITIDKSNYQAYRDLFAIVFTDFHLFDKFYGVDDIDVEKVNYWLEKMQLHNKVTYQNGGFTSTSLSTGQRKRLAFIAAMLEDKPILVIDEFAADQDPQFRHYFYETLLSEVRAMGKTIIAVTHDNQYFHKADRVWGMEEGRVRRLL